MRIALGPVFNGNIGSCLERFDVVLTSRVLAFLGQLMEVLVYLPIYQLYSSVPYLICSVVASALNLNRTI
jgi:hypothetical protein